VEVLENLQFKKQIVKHFTGFPTNRIKFDKTFLLINFITLQTKIQVYFPKIFTYEINR